MTIRLSALLLFLFSLIVSSAATYSGTRPLNPEVLTIADSSPANDLKGEEESLGDIARKFHTHTIRTYAFLWMGHAAVQLRGIIFTLLSTLSPGLYITSISLSGVLAFIAIVFMIRGWRTYKKYKQQLKNGSSKMGEDYKEEVARDKAALLLSLLLVFTSLFFGIFAV